jgi:hypothetical protein
MKLYQARLGLFLAVGSLLFASSAFADEVTYGWVPDPGSSGSGVLVIDDPAIHNDVRNFGSPGTIIPATSLVALSYTYPESGLTFNLSDFNEQNTDLGNAVGPDGWTASGGEITNIFDFIGRSTALGNLGIQKIRVSQGGNPVNGLNDLLELFENEQGMEMESQTGHWEFVSSVPEPSSALLIGMGLAGFSWRGRAKRS